jgi:hypothetical protein
VATRNLTLLRMVNSARVMWLVLACMSAGCGRWNVTTIGEQEAATISFEFIGKAGTTTQYYADPKLAISVPNGYRLVGEKLYYIETSVIPYGETILTFKTRIINEDDFRKVRILTLSPSEIPSSGYVWQDCTLQAPPDSDDRDDPQIAAERRERLSRFTPNFQSQTVSCNAKEFGSENYFAVVVDTLDAQNQPISHIEGSLDKVELSPDGATTTYQVSIKNTGPSDVSEVSLYSHFDDDSKVDSVVPSQGNCKKANFGSTLGSVVCHLGAIQSGSKVVMEFIGSPRKAATLPHSTTRNSGWEIWIYVQVKPGDRIWPSNELLFIPSKSKTTPLLDGFKKEPEPINGN